MLDFYVAADLSPWPDDVPADGERVGGIDLHDYQLCGAAIEGVLAEVGVVASYFDDWIVPLDLLDTVRGRLVAANASLDPWAQTPMLEFIRIVQAAEGRTLLAVCD